MVEASSPELRRLSLLSLKDISDDSSDDPQDDDGGGGGGIWSTGFHRSSSPRSRRLSTTPSPSPSPPSPQPLSSSSSSRPLSRFASARSQPQEHYNPKKRRGRRTRGLLTWTVVVAFFLLVNFWTFSTLQDASAHLKIHDTEVSSLPPVLGEWKQYMKFEKPRAVMFARLLALAAHALAEAEDKAEPRDLWKEDLASASSWVPCSDQRNWESCEGRNGYILVSANGGINQQRIAICNAVAVARFLNSTLVLPKFQYSNVWQDPSEFSDIYQEDHFINSLRDDIRIVKELPAELQSLDLEAIGSVVTDEDIMKESKPSFYLRKILPIILRNRVVHLIGFGNRLAFDPIPFDLQRLRCRCNFHALRFVKKIEDTGALLLKRMRHNMMYWGPVEDSLVGSHKRERDINILANATIGVPKFLAVHLRFEIDMAAYSLCYFGGGKVEEEELEAYRKVHFPALTKLKRARKLPPPEVLRSEGQCPLTPEETVLLLAALGFKRSTSVYIAGAVIYGGKSRMAALASLYPNVATKESLLSSSEIGPFRNFSSQLAALDFIVCAAADAFAMTDSGSQFSSLVQGYRIYYGRGSLPTIRPNKRRLVSAFSKNSTIEWKEFEHSVRKAVRQSKKVLERPTARSVYRHPRCLQCMCPVEYPR